MQPSLHFPFDAYLSPQKCSPTAALIFVQEMLGMLVLLALLVLLVMLALLAPLTSLSPASHPPAPAEASISLPAD